MTRQPSPRMHQDSIPYPQRRTVSHKRSTVDDSLSFSTSEDSAQSGRKLHERSVIFPSRFDYALVIISLQTGTTQLIYIFIQVERFGGAIIFLTTVLITIFITLPLMTHQIFYGFYNRCGFIKFWNMAPVGLGIGLSMALYSVYECVVWGGVAGLLILHVCHVPFRSISEYNICKKIKRPEEVLCYDAESKLPTTSCQFTRYPAFEFHHEISYEPQLEGNGYISINGPWFVCCTIVWLIVFLMVSQGFRRLKHILIKISMLCLLSLGLLVVFSFASQEKVSSEQKEMLFHVRQHPTHYAMISLVWHAIRVVQIPLGTLYQLGSYIPPGTPVFTDSVMILLFVCFYNFAFAYFAHCCLAWVVQGFVAINQQCLTVDIMSTLFASVPTAISFLAMGNLWLVIFYSTFALKTIIQMVITLTATMNSMSEMFPLHRHRQPIVAVLCTVALLLNLPLTMIDSEIFFTRTYRYIERLIDLSIITVARIVCIGLYTPSRVFDDIHFVTGVEPVMFQKLISYLSPVLLAFIIIIGFVSLVSKWHDESIFHIDSWAGPFISFTSILLLAPIPVVALYMYIIHLMKHNISGMLQPTANWGPPEPEVKRARLNFNPRTELRHKSKKPCTHNCLLNNFRIKIEVEKRDSQRKEFFLNTLKSSSYVEWDDDEDWHYGGDIIGKVRAIDWASDFERVLSPTMVNDRNEDQEENEIEEKIDEERWSEDMDDVEVEKDREEAVQGGTVDVDVNDVFVSDEDTKNEMESDVEPDVILPNLNSIDLHPRIQHLDTHVGADRTLPSPRYSVENPTYLRRRRSKQKRPAKAPIEPVTRPPTRKTYPRVEKKWKRQSRTKSCQTEKGMKRLKNLLQVVLPWKKNNGKKHRCVGTNPGCSRPRDSSGSSRGSETLSDTSEWP